MKWKQFLKPHWKKIVIFIIVAFLVMLLTSFLSVEKIAIPEAPSITKIGYPVFLTITSGFLIERPIYEWNFINFIINIIMWYLVSSLIIWVYDKMKKKF